MMRTFYRGVCIAAAALISLGLLLSLLGFALGGRPGDLADYYDGADLPFIGSGRIGPLRWGSWGNPLYGRDTVEQSYGGPELGIRKLDFELSCADVVIKEGEVFRVKAEKINAKRFSTRLDGDTWEIECDVEHAGRMGGDKAPKITITVPKGFQAEELELDAAMGTVEMKDLAAKVSTLKVGMGTVTAKNITSGDCEMEIGMGTLEFSGTLTGKSSIDCGMGSAELTLRGDPQDYGFYATVGMGSVTVNGEDVDTESPNTPGPWGIAEIGGLGGQRSWNTTAPNLLYVDCGMGSVDIRFAG